MISTIGPAGSSQLLTWQQWHHLPGVVDLAGPRSDGRLVATAMGRLSLVSKAGRLSPFARGPKGYSTQPAGEPYITLSAGSELPRSRCKFEKDDVFALELSPPHSVVRITAAGNASRFAELADLEGLSGIAFDSAGTFGNRLLVTGRSKGRSLVSAIDCRGQVQTITDAAPRSEGGIVVAPRDFGDFGGDLVAVDEGSGKIFAIAPDGKTSLVADSGIPAGGDVGVEAPGFLPKGFTAGGAVYLADWGVPGQPHPGTDTILRLTSGELKRAGVLDGDLIVAAEAGGLTIDVRCRQKCSVTSIARATDAAHAEGHLIAAIERQDSTVRRGRTARGFLGLIAVALILLFALALLTRRRVR